MRTRILLTPEDFHACYLASLAFAGLSNREAERSWLERALVIAPKNTHIETSLGISRLRDGDTNAAHAAFDKAIRHSWNFAPARYNRALIELEAMHFARGWSDYEWRFSYPSAPGVWREFPSPVWDGTSPLDGKLLVWAEQSISTQILFSSVLWELDLPGGLIIETAAELIPLLERAMPDVEIVPVATPANPRLFQDDIAAQIPLGRLCGLKRQSLEAFKNGKQNFLYAEAERSIDLMLDLAKPEKFTIGLAWREGGVNGVSLPLAQLENLLRVPNITWVSLEDDQALAEIGAFEAKTGIHIVNDHGVDTACDLDGLAALVLACDLVLSVDKPAAHLAGALGQSVWTLLPDRRMARWYWFSGHLPRPIKLARWYPSMRLV
ncbi:MAG: hypothetical protein OSB69_20085, partial [Alphaproteobacteria bacterium]|nr:hypothetical protein [Alphaproteobacteria bacterium]